MAEYIDRKEQRNVNETMASLLLPLKEHCDENTKECIDKTLYILKETKMKESRDMSDFANWIDDGYKVGIHNNSIPVYKCKFCKKRILVLPVGVDAKANYCPVCGKDMGVK